MVKDREAWRAAVHGVARVGHNWVTEQQQKYLFVLHYIANAILKFKNKFEISYMEI